ncbi:Neurexin-3a-alpha [Eufriesea mexicana]|uniref:Neurexin-3a-alpha n=1 Tax=Eufriesea mexicana TaxID=516756 RepID=A0A310SSP8_9HYME|nr:Neurexin-3a-alpha [Eufriesea mexicana]
MREYANSNSGITGLPANEESLRIDEKERSFWKLGGNHDCLGKKGTSESIAWVTDGLWPVSSREPSRGLIHLRNRRSRYALTTYVSDQTQRTHQPRSTNAEVEASTLVRGCTVVAAALVQVQCVAANRTHGLDEKNGAYAEPREPDRSRNKRTLDGRRRGVTSLESGNRTERRGYTQQATYTTVLVSVIHGNTRAIVPWDRGATTPTMHSSLVTSNVGALLPFLVVSLSQLALSFVLEGSATSYAQFRKWNAGQNGTLEFEFKTEQGNGLLLYTDDGGTYDFFEVKLVESALRLRYNLGGGAQIVTVGHDLGDGHWHKVQITRCNENTTLTVDGVSAVSTSRGKEFEFGKLAGNSDVYVGGMPSWYNSKLTLLALPSVIFEPRFNGFIRNLVYADGENTMPRRQEMKSRDAKEAVGTFDFHRESRIEINATLEPAVMGVENCDSRVVVLGMTRQTHPSNNTSKMVENERSIGREDKMVQ